MMDDEATKEYIDVTFSFKTLKQAWSNVKFYSREDSREAPALITPFSLVHFVVSVFASSIALRIFPRSSYFTSLMTWSFIHLMYEFNDVFKSYVLMKTGYYFNKSAQNSIGDQVIAMTGFSVGYFLIKSLRDQPGTKGAADLITHPITMGGLTGLITYVMYLHRAG